MFGDDRLVPYWGRYNIWEMSLYLSATGVVLIVLAARRFRERLVFICGLLAAALILLALGRHTPLLRLLYHTTPGFDLFRSMARFMAPALLFLALLAGFGAQRLISHVPGKGVRTVPISLIVFPAILLVAAAAGYGWGDMPGWWPRLQRWLLGFGERLRVYISPAEFTEQTVRNSYIMAWLSLVRAGYLCGGLAIVALVSSVLRPRAGRVLLVVGILGLLCGDLYNYCSRYIVTFDANTWIWDEEVSEFFTSQREPFRVSSPATWADGPSDPMMYGVGTLEGIEPNVPNRFNALFRFTQAEPADVMRTSYHIARHSPVFDLLNLRYVVRSNAESATRPPDEIERFSSPRLVVTERKSSMPRAFVVHTYEIIADEKRALGRLTSMNYRKAALLEKRPSIEPQEPDSPSSVVVEEYLPERVVLNVACDAPGLLVLSDIYYPGWIAEVDGSRAEILRADYALRAVALPEGKHTVEFRYEPFWFKFGAWTSGLSWAALVTYFIGSLARKRRG